MCYRVKIFLYEISPQIWRRFSVDSEMTFGELHQVIQKAMGWESKHTHEFRYGKGRQLKNVIADPEDEVPCEGEFHNENELTLGAFLGRKRLPMRMIYRYDFTEDWIHELVFEGKEETSEKGVKDFEGERACPPEDSGGAWTYNEALSGNIEWMDDDYDPEFFDETAVKF